jgi:GNAT superfamily N-acetyltransferase|tara:strand:- start:509 stop:943 length:435 start_codon:yes stop_codon:yes gene_type:complete
MLRHAGVEDLSALYKMLHVMHEESEHTVSSINSEKGTAAMVSAIHRGVVLIAEVDGEIAGSIGGMKSEDWWSTEKYLADLWFFVYKEHRKSTIAVRLIKRFMEIGKNANLKVKLGHVHGGDTERKDNFYTRLGLVKAGSMYLET